ncbi:hypothetical protein [Pleionea litopenaei]|uniref:Uncharacterized protein n=1 Tax=Pleionea litopenaei TaxID=3070815 RepID=A0AA51RRI8_9GAMM|nr:hypothetical protein [Pleionea sp. HL-JVS1]WMS86149.1 hypothetical protein Q9312_13065 [Pleionea sp. HL-JVS1]
MSTLTSIAPSEKAIHAEKTSETQQRLKFKRIQFLRETYRVFNQAMANK